MKRLRQVCPAKIQCSLSRTYPSQGSEDDLSEGDCVWPLLRDVRATRRASPSRKTHRAAAQTADRRIETWSRVDGMARSLRQGPAFGVKHSPSSSLSGTQPRISRPEALDVKNTAVWSFSRTALFQRHDTAFSSKRSPANEGHGNHGEPVICCRVKLLPQVERHDAPVLLGEH